MNIELKKVDINNLPKEEVLCASFEKGPSFGQFIVGWIETDNFDVPICETEFKLLAPVTHYAKIKFLEEYFR